jgi:hypothetical protein
MGLYILIPHEREEGEAARYRRMGRGIHLTYLSLILSCDSTVHSHTDTLLYLFIHCPLHSASAEGINIPPPSLLSEVQPLTVGVEAEMGLMHMLVLASGKHEDGPRNRVLIGAFFVNSSDDF